MDSLIAEYEQWCTLRGYPHMSAEELSCELWAIRSGEKSELVQTSRNAQLLKNDMLWLGDFIERWEDMERDR